MKTLTEHFADFERFRIASQMKPADKTIKTFIRFCERVAPEQELQQWMVNKWCAKRDGETFNSQYTRVAHINTFLRFLHTRTMPNILPYEDIKWRSRPKNIIFITRDELQNFFMALNELPIETRGQRIEAMTWSVIFRVFYSLGLRPLEARMLSVQDVDTNEGVLKISHTKGYRQHLVVADEHMKILLNRYDELMRVAFPHRDFFFVLKNGKGINGVRLNVKFQEIWKKYNSRRCVVYHFRHNYAIENINSWINIGYDQRWDRLISLSNSMGHSKLKETLYYYSLAPQYANELKELSEENLKVIIPVLPNDEEKE